MGSNFSTIDEMEQVPKLQFLRLKSHILHLITRVQNISYSSSSSYQIFSDISRPHKTLESFLLLTALKKLGQCVTILKAKWLIFNKLCHFYLNDHCIIRNLDVWFLKIVCSIPAVVFGKFLY